MTRPRVVHLISGLGVGGAERVVLDIAGHMHEEGWPVSVVSMGKRVDILAHSRWQGLRVASAGLDRGARSASPFALRRLLRELALAKPQIIHAHMYHALLAALLWKIFRPRVKIVFTSHSSRIPGFRRAIIRLTRFARSCDVIFYKFQHPEINCRRVAVIPNGTAMPVSSPRVPEKNRKGAWRIIAVGRLVPLKATKELVRQFARLQRSDVVLDIVGDGIQRAEIADLVAQLGLEGRVALLGARTDVSLLLDSSHLFVLASDWEGMPISVLEAGARGLPVLATPVGGVPEMLEDHCGFVAERDEFPKTLDRIFSDYEQALHRGENFRKKVAERYSIKAIAGSHCDLYGHLLRNVQDEQSGCFPC